MATYMNTQTGNYTRPRSSIQKVCIALGIFFVVVGLGGIIMPGMLGMHLSMAHNIIHLLSGALSLWVGYSDDPRKAYNFALAFGVIYGLLGLVGFVSGKPGYPGVGHMEADQNLLRVIPNVLEFGSMDHGIHILLSAIFLLSAYAWKHARVPANKSTATRNFTVTGTNLKNSESDLKDASLGRSDINRPIDQGRRTDFENRI